MKKKANIKSCLQPMPKVLISCRGKNGEDNALAVAYCGNCSFDPVSYTHLDVYKRQGHFL